jgi:hypothetical protein
MRGFEVAKLGHIGSTEIDDRSSNLNYLFGPEISERSDPAAVDDETLIGDA